jgi:hypothetical protein
VDRFLPPMTKEVKRNKSVRSHYLRILVDFYFRKES